MSVLSTLSRANWTHKSAWDIEDNAIKDQQIKLLPLQCKGFHSSPERAASWGVNG